MNTIGTIHPPELSNSIPSNSQWLSGQGAGVWFCIEKTENQKQFRVRRFNPEGKIDCDRIFDQEENGLEFDVDKSYQFVHVSHCAKCRIKQSGVMFTFNYIEQHL